MASRSMQLAKGRHLSVAMTLASHDQTYYYTPDGEGRECHMMAAISYFPDGKQIISGSTDKTARVWNLQAGKEIEKARVLCKEEVKAVAVSMDGRWIIIACGSDLNGEEVLKAYEVKMGMKIFKGHSREITCVDVSKDCKLLASSSWDCTIRIWNLETGDCVAGPLRSVSVAISIRFSRDSRKLAAKASYSKLEVWDIEAQELDVAVTKDPPYYGSNAPVFWTTQDRTIVAAFSFAEDRNLPSSDVGTIYEFDASTLKTVQGPFKGHTSSITGLVLSFDCALLVSASIDRTIKLWAFESRQLLASFNDIYYTWTVILSPDAHQIAYTTSEYPPKIYISDIPPDIIANIWPSQEGTSANARKNPHVNNPLDMIPPTCLPDRHPAAASVATRSLRYAPHIPQQQPFFLRHLRKLLPSFSGDPYPFIHTVVRDDILDCPATSPRLVGQSYLQLNSNGVHLHPDGNSMPSRTLPTSTTIRSRLSHISNWWPVRTGHASPPVVDVPFAPGKLRYATTGAPRRDDGYVRDEDFDSNSNLQRTSAGEHTSGRFCFCL